MNDTAYLQSLRSDSPAARLLSSHWERRAWLLWLVFAIVIVALKYNEAPVPGHVFDMYRQTGARWLQGLPIYGEQLFYNYLPTSVLLFVPFTWLPFEVGGAIWRALNIGVFAFGLWHFTRAIQFGRFASPSFPTFAIVSVTTILLCGSAAKHGQITLLMAGLLFLSLADLQRGAFWRAAWLAALAVMFKPHAIVLFLVLVALNAEFRWRAILALALLALLPFLFQEGRYVLEQYATFPDMIRFRIEITHLQFQHLFDMLASVGITVPTLGQIIVRSISALAVLALSWRVIKTNSLPGRAFYLYAFSCCYILLLGEAIESNTYAIMAPVLGVLAAFTWATGQKPYFIAVCVLIVATLLSHTLLKLFPDYVFMQMIKPAVCVLLFVLLLRQRRLHIIQPSRSSSR